MLYQNPAVAKKWSTASAQNQVVPMDASTLAEDRAQNVEEEAKSFIKVGSGEKVEVIRGTIHEGAGRDGKL